MKIHLLILFLMLGTLFSEEYNCPFCNSEIINKQVYYEDDVVIGLYTHKPCVEGHCLIIPKRHVARYEDLTEKEVLGISKLIKKTHLAVLAAYGKSEYLLLEKNGKSSGQHIFHVHFHLIPAVTGNNRLLFLAKILLRPLFPAISISELQKNIDKICQVL